MTPAALALSHNLAVGWHLTCSSLAGGLLIGRRRSMLRSPLTCYFVGNMESVHLQSWCWTQQPFQLSPELFILVFTSLHRCLGLLTSLHCCNEFVLKCIIIMLKHLAYRLGSADVVKRLYLGLVRPSLEYASPVWDACSRADSLSLERVQLSIARAVLRRCRRDLSNVSVLSLIGWPTLAWRRRRFKLLLFWHLLHGGGPPSLQALVPPMVSARAPYALRNQSSVAFPRCTSSRHRRSFLPSSVSLWNSLPPSVTSSSSASSFLRSIDAHFHFDRYSFGLLS